MPVKDIVPSCIGIHEFEIECVGIIKQFFIITGGIKEPQPPRTEFSGLRKNRNNRHFLQDCIGAQTSTCTGVQSGTCTGRVSKPSASSAIS